MADPIFISIALVSIISSATAFSATTYELIKRVKKTDADLQIQLQEIQVMNEVFQECLGIIDNSQNLKIPASVERASKICHSRYVELMELMVRLRAERLDARTKLSRWTRVLITDNERRAAFGAFRTSGLLLRDLCTDIRLRQQLVNMSASLAELMGDCSDDQDTGQERASRPNHVYLSPEADQDQATAGGLSETRPVDLASPSPRRNFIGETMSNLIQQNFTRNVTMVIDSGVGTLPERLTYAHVRAKMDTGCNDNLITMELVQKAGIDESLLIAIPEEETVYLYGLENARCAPLYQLDISWYQDGDMKMRHSRFYVVKEGPFDMLIGSGRFAQDLNARGKPGLLAIKKKKKKAEQKKEDDRRTSHLRREREDEDREREAKAQSTPQAPARQPQASNQAPPQASTSGSQNVGQSRPP